MKDLITLFIHSIIISASTFGGGSQALFYQFGVIETAWITSIDLSAVLALGYATPGPAVFTTSTFIGYRIQGIFGAIVGTIGIFSVPTVCSIFAARYLARFTNNNHAKYFIKYVGLAASGLVAATAFLVFNYKSAAYWQFIIAILSFIASIRYSINPLIVILVATAIGLIFT